MSTTMNVKRISIEPDLLGESPTWDPRDERLFWVDGAARKVRCRDRDEQFQAWTMPSVIGSIALAEGNSLIVALAEGICRLDLATGALDPLFCPDPQDPAVRFNDGKCDRQGRFLCGSMGVHAAPLGRLYRLAPEGDTAVLAENICISNTLCFSPGGTVLYFADSLERSIRAYDYDIATGTVGERRQFASTDAHGSGPDGATVDAEGCLWVALILVGKIARFTPDGNLDRLLDAPTDLPSSLAFGGPDLSTLFVTSIKDSGSGRAISKHPDGGHLFAIEDLGVSGLPEMRFGAVNRPNGSSEIRP